jgi:hypothetical protein
MAVEEGYSYLFYTAAATNSPEELSINNEILNYLLYSSSLFFTFFFEVETFFACSAPEGSAALRLKPTVPFDFACACVTLYNICIYECLW